MIPFFTSIRASAIHARFRHWLGREGVDFFTELYRDHGKLSVVLPADGVFGVPYPVHFREGMQVRNWMRKNTNVPEERLDDEWESFVVAALGLTKEEAA